MGHVLIESRCSFSLFLLRVFSSADFLPPLLPAIVRSFFLSSAQLRALSSAPASSLSSTAPTAAPSAALASGPLVDDSDEEEDDEEMDTSEKQKAGQDAMEEEQEDAEEDAEEQEEAEPLPNEEQLQTATNGFLYALLLGQVAALRSEDDEDEAPSPTKSKKQKRGAPADSPAAADDGVVLCSARELRQRWLREQRAVLDAHMRRLQEDGEEEEADEEPEADE